MHLRVSLVCFVPLAVTSNPATCENLWSGDSEAQMRKSRPGGFYVLFQVQVMPDQSGLLHNPWPFDSELNSRLLPSDPCACLGFDLNPHGRLYHLCLSLLTKSVPSLLHSGCCFLE